MHPHTLLRIFAVATASLWCARVGSLSVSAPDQMLVLEGSCLNVPCSFSPAALEMEIQLIRPSTFLRLTKTVFSSSSSRRWDITRTGSWALIGNFSVGDCSLALSKAESDDQNSYELKLKPRGQVSWTTSTRFNISVTKTPAPPKLSDPGVVKEGQPVWMNCSVRLSCLTQRPRLHWKFERGDPGDTRVSEELVRDPGQLPILRSILFFTVPHNVNPRLRCEAEFSKDWTASSAREIHVHFPPKDVVIQVLSLSVFLGGNALLSCSCKSDPPVSKYQWTSVQSGTTRVLASRAPTVRVHNLTRDTLVQCTVANNLGHAKSLLTNLDVKYAPVILSSSSCTWDGALLSCTCTVNSNPRPAVTWSVNGSLPPDGSNMSFTYSHDVLTATLHALPLPLPVRCFAINTVGNDSRSLFDGEHGAVMWTRMTAGCVVLVMLLLLLVTLLCYWRAHSRRRSFMIQSRGLSRVYQDRLPLYINCSEVTHVYTNGSYQIVYQNCTPRFIRVGQIHKRERRGARRQRLAPVMSPDSDTAVYVEVI